MNSIDGVPFIGNGWMQRCVKSTCLGFWECSSGSYDKLLCHWKHFGVHFRLDKIYALDVHSTTEAYTVSYTHFCSCYITLLVACIPYSGKFSRGSNFRDFRDPRPKRENKNHAKSLARSDNGTASLFQTGRRRLTGSHGRSFVLC